MKPRVLLVASKHPAEDDLDGGAILVRQLAARLPLRSSVAALWLRTTAGSSSNFPGIKTLGYLPPDASSRDRFESRIASYSSVADALSAAAGLYDRIVITHVSNAFGLSRLDPSVGARTVLFPMFTAVSYRRAGEFVPDRYREMEAAAMRRCSRIISPSRQEASQLVDDYGVDQRTIFCVPRGIDLENFRHLRREVPRADLDVLCVGSIKPQKNHRAYVALVEALERRGRRCRLHVVGGIADPAYFETLRRDIEATDTRRSFVFHGPLTPEGVARAAASCHIAISLAAWETFGRGIFEGLATGLPTIVAKHLACVWEHVAPGAGAHPVSTPDEAAAVIDHLIASPARYADQARLASLSVGHLSQRVLVDQMVSAIFDAPPRERKSS